jgi:hypothetical protein
MLVYLWIVIPLAGIAYVAFAEWLKFKRQTARIGSSTAELESAVEEFRGELESFREERAALVRRIENLETIVTSEVWDALGEDRELTQSKAPELRLPEPEDPDDADRAAQLAKRLRS